MCQRCYQQVEFNSINTVESIQAQTHLDKVMVMNRYQTPVKQLITAFKYKSVKNIGIYLADMVYRHLQLPPADCVSFVPISYVRRCERGFNQSQVIAARLAARINKPCLKLITKTKHTSHQAQLSYEQRLTNLTDCYQLKAKHKNQLAQFNSVLLIDDVITTGTTFNQCAQIIKNAGCNQVTALAIASRH